MIYLDNAATTKPCRAAVEAAADAAEHCFGNVSSLHGMGVLSEKRLNSAKNTILSRLKQSGELYFTSGATESSNIALRGVCETYKRRGNTIVTTAIEHPSVARVCDYLEKNGFKIIRLSPKDAVGAFEEYIADAVDADTLLVTCMAVNNENGFITDTNKLYKLVKRKNKDTVVHVDGVQGFCKIPLCGDLISLSAHKINGFKGVGALYCAKGIRFAPLFFGGGQQGGMRSGTEPIELISAFEAAASQTFDTDKFRRLGKALRDDLSLMDGVVFNSGEGEGYLPCIVNFSVLGVRSEIMLHFLEESEIYVSSGSACSKGSVSGVPSAFGLDAGRADSAIRVSFCMDNTEEEIHILSQRIEDGIKRFRRGRH